MSITEKQLQDIRARHAATPAGPWRWTGYQPSRQVHLSTRWDSIMEFRRWGTQSAQPLFNTGGLLCTASELAVPDSSPERGRISDIDHPSARFIAASWQDVADLLDEVGRLRAVIASHNRGEG